MRDRQILLGMRDFIGAKTRPLNFKGLSESVTFGISPLGIPNGKIQAIRVQDIAKQLWFNYTDGVWDKAPECTVGDGTLYIAAYTRNDGDSGLIRQLIKNDQGMALADKTEDVVAGASFGDETGTISMPDRAYGITVAATP